MGWQGRTLRVPPWGGTPRGVPCKVGLSTLKWLLLLQWKVRSVRARVPRCDAGAACKSLLETGECDRYHPRPEVQYAKGGLAEKGACVKSAASAPVVAAAPETENEDDDVARHPNRYAVFLSRGARPVDVLGDSGATLNTGNIPDEYLHDLHQLPLADQFRLDGISGPVLITTVANIYCKVPTVVFDTDAAAEVRARFESLEYLGADRLYYYFVLPMYRSVIVSELADAAGHTSPCFGQAVSTIGLACCHR